MPGLRCVWSTRGISKTCRGKRRTWKIVSGCSSCTRSDCCGVRTGRPGDLRSQDTAALSDRTDSVRGGTHWPEAQTNGDLILVKTEPCGCASGRYAESSGTDEREAEPRDQRPDGGQRFSNCRRDSERGAGSAETGQTEGPANQGQRGNNHEIAGRRLPPGASDHAATCAGPVPSLSA